MEFDRVQLKQDVKRSMKCTSSGPMRVTLVFVLVVFVGTGLINALLGGPLTGGLGSVSETMLSYIGRGYEVEEALNITMLELFRRGPGAMFGVIVGGSVLSILVSLWQSTMNVGYEGYCLAMVRGENPPLGMTFCILPEFGRAALTRVLTGLFLFLWMLLMMAGWTAMLMVFAALAMVVNSELLLTLLMVISIPLFWVGTIWVTLRYALVDYVLLDRGETGMNAIREGRRLMKGRLTKALVLRLSFFGWYFLLFLLFYWGVIALIMAFVVYLYSMGSGSGTGVALVLAAAALIGGMALLIWLRPYTTGSMARFYDWAKADADGNAGGSGYGGDGGWGQPGGYTQITDSTSGTGIGSGPKDSGPYPGGRPKPPKRDDPWE